MTRGRAHSSSKRKTLVVEVLSLLLLTLGLGVAEAAAQARAAPNRTRSPVSARRSAPSRSATHLAAPGRRTAGNTRQFNRSRSGSRYRRSPYRSHFRHGSYLNLSFGYGFRSYLPYAFYSGAYLFPSVYGGYGRSYGASRYLGALDLNIKPKKAEVYLDGEYIGLVKDFDGYPSYLWLERGTYDISFYLPGYQTLTRSLKLFPGTVVDVRLRLEPGEAVMPEKPARSRARITDRYPRRDSMREDERDRRDPEFRRPRKLEEERERDLRGEPGRLRLGIVPEDATVYMDGRFLGSGEELSRLHAGLVVEPGDHLLEVVRPGFEAKRLEVRVGEGEEVELSVELTKG